MKSSLLRQVGVLAALERLSEHGDGDPDTDAVVAETGLDRQVCYQNLHRLADRDNGEVVRVPRPHDRRMFWALSPLGVDVLDELRSVLDSGMQNRIRESRTD